MHSSNIISRICPLIFAIAALTLLAGGVSAGTKQLGNHTVGDIDVACINAGGTATGGTGKGGYGCDGPGGSVSCTAKGACTGTCQACADSRAGGVKGSTGAIGEVLRAKANGSGPDSNTADTPSKPTQSTQRPVTRSTNQPGNQQLQPARPGNEGGAHK